MGSHYYSVGVRLIGANTNSDILSDIEFFFTEKYYL